jgi:flagellar biosynthesis/type III secretory pathway M-ring protein FliF/YscJ
MLGEDIISLLLVVFILLIIFVGMFIVVKKRWKDKKHTMYRAQFTGQNVYMQFQNLQKKKSIEHVLHQKEEKKQDDEGDDIKRFFQSTT